jgi:hypothetical protein
LFAISVSEVLSTIGTSASSRRHSPEAAATGLGADEGLRSPMVLRRHGPREVDRSAGDMRVNIDAAGKNNQARRVDRAPAGNRGGETARIVDEQVADLAVDAVRGVVDGPSEDSKHHEA